MASNIFSDFEKDARKAGAGSLASGYRPNIPTKKSSDEEEVKKLQNKELEVKEEEVKVAEEDVESVNDSSEDVVEPIDEIEEAGDAAEESVNEISEPLTETTVSSKRTSGNIERSERSREFLDRRRRPVKEETEDEESAVQEKVSLSKKTIKDYESDLKARRELKEFGSLIVETEDGDYYWNTKSKTVRVEIGQAILSGVRDYLASLYGEDIKTFSNPQLTTYLLIKQLPKDIREDLANQIAIENNGYDKVYNQVVEDLARDSDPASLKNIARDVAMVKEELSLISSSQTNQFKEMSETFPALLLACAFLLGDRMDLRKKFNEGSFKNFIVKEDDVSEWMEDLVNLGYSYRSRLETKNNTQRRRSMHPSRRRR